MHNYSTEFDVDELLAMKVDAARTVQDVLVERTYDIAQGAGVRFPVTPWAQPDVNAEWDEATGTVKVSLAW